ncbi:protein of unknown function [Burkholderia multivorans]
MNTTRRMIPSRSKPDEMAIIPEPGGDSGEYTAGHFDRVGQPGASSAGACHRPQRPRTARPLLHITKSRADMLHLASGDDPEPRSSSVPRIVSALADDRRNFPEHLVAQAIPGKPPHFARKGRVPVAAMITPVFCNSYIRYKIFDVV